MGDTKGGGGRKKHGIDWHIACQGAMQAILVDYRDELRFVPEYPLYSKPLRLDNIVIKTEPGLRIDKNIARHFLGHNIVEYKSYNDSLTVSKYHKAIAYAHLYPEASKAGYRDVTLTFICTRHPRELLKDLRSSGVYDVTEPYGGIYAVEGERFPVRIIEVKRLVGSDADDAVWFECLRRDAKAETISRAIELEKGLPVGAVNTEPFWDIVKNANTVLLKELEIMSEKRRKEWRDAFIRWGWAQEWEAAAEARGVVLGETRGVAVGEARATQQTIAIIKDLQQNRSPEWIAGERGVSVENVEYIARELRLT